MPKPAFMDLPLPFVGKQEALAAIDQATAGRPVRIATPNPEQYLEAARNPRFRESLLKMTHCIVDGNGLQIMLRTWQAASGTRRPPALYHGADLVHDLLSRYQDGSKAFYLIGGPPGLAATAEEAIGKQFPGCRVVGAEDGGQIDSSHPVPDPELIRRIERSGADILLVGFGAPKQERWIAAARSTVPVMIGIGGSLGFYGSKKRASGWLRRLRLEWLYRALTEPGHLARAWRAAVVFPVYSLLWIGKNLAR